MHFAGLTVSSGTVNTLKSGFRGGKIVHRLDEFPELEKALRDGDLLTGRLFCAELFHFDGRQSFRERGEPLSGVGIVPSPLASQ
jgi:hypothetical protein